MAPLFFGTRRIHVTVVDQNVMESHTSFSEIYPPHWLRGLAKASLHIKKNSSGPLSLSCAFGCGNFPPDQIFLSFALFQPTPPPSPPPVVQAWAWARAWACAQIVELEGLSRVTSWEVGLLLGDERAGRGTIQERAMLVAMMEARRKRGQLPGPAWWGGEPPGLGWAEERGPTGRCSAARPGTDGTPNGGAQRYVAASAKPHHSNRIWLEIFLNCSTGGHSSNDAGHRKTTNRGSQNSGRGCM